MKRCVQHLVELALQAPEVLSAFASGEQSEGITWNYLIKTRVPVVFVRPVPADHQTLRLGPIVGLLSSQNQICPETIPR